MSQDVNGLSSLIIFVFTLKKKTMKGKYKYLL